MHRLLRENWYRDVWLIITTGLTLWAIALTFQASSENHRSLCALRADLEHRVANSRSFLNSHPQGAFGFSRAVIVKSATDQQRSIRALRYLDCPE